MQDDILQTFTLSNNVIERDNFPTMDCIAFVAQKTDPNYIRNVSVVVIGNVLNISYALIPPISTQFTTLTNVYIADNIFYRSKKQSVWGVGLLLMKLVNNTFYD